MPLLPVAIVQIRLVLCLPRLELLGIFRADEGVVDREQLRVLEPPSPDADSTLRGEEDVPPAAVLAVSVPDRLVLLDAGRPDVVQLVWHVGRTVPLAFDPMRCVAVAAHP